MKTLYFDLEHGSQTLGSESTIQKMFGYTVLSPGSWDAFQNIIGQIYTKKNVEVDKKIGALIIKEQQESVVLRDNAPTVDAVVVDTFSELSKKFMRSLVNKNTGKMMLQDWGKLKNKLDGCLEFVTQIPGVVICNCHSKIQTMDDGQNKLLPYIDGSTKEDIAKWFDFVFYTKTNVGIKGDAEYTWVTGRSEKYDHAKDRTGTLEREIPQNYQLVLDAANKSGFNGSKILVIGTPGSGKTYALKTLAGHNEEKIVKKHETKGVNA
jgi:DNA segregation ATPase FtsK/SpoIIIE-like protein